MQVATRVLEDGVVWRPQHDSHYIVAGVMVSARSAPPVCILQSVLQAVERQLEEGEAPVGFGVLTGRPCHCPKTRKDYVLVEGAHACAATAGGVDEHAAMAQALAERVTELERAGHVVAGYYRGGAAVVPRPAQRDVGILRTLFAEPWQLMLLRAAGPAPVAAAVVRVEPIGSRAYAASFVELLPTRKRNRDGTPSSAVAWSTYHPNEPVTPLPAAPSRPAAAVGEAARTGAATAPDAAGAGVVSRIASLFRRRGEPAAPQPPPPATPTTVAPRTVAPTTAARTPPARPSPATVTPPLRPNAASAAMDRLASALPDTRPKPLSIPEPPPRPEPLPIPEPLPAPPPRPAPTPRPATLRTDVPVPSLPVSRPSLSSASVASASSSPSASMPPVSTASAVSASAVSASAVSASVVNAPSPSILRPDVPRRDAPGTNGSHATPSDASVRQAAPSFPLMLGPSDADVRPAASLRLWLALWIVLLIAAGAALHWH